MLCWIHRNYRFPCYSCALFCTINFMKILDGYFELNRRYFKKHEHFSKKEQAGSTIFHIFEYDAATIRNELLFMVSRSRKQNERTITKSNYRTHGSPRKHPSHPFRKGLRNKTTIEDPIINPLLRDSKQQKN